MDHGLAFAPTQTASLTKVIPFIMRLSPARIFSYVVVHIEKTIIFGAL